MAPNVTTPELAIVVDTGASQTGIAGQPLPAPVVITVVDTSRHGKPKPVSGQIVNWVVTSGGGSVYVEATETARNGQSRNLWTLGDSVGRQTLEARAVDPRTGAPIIFGRITAEASSPAPTWHTLVPASEAPSGGSFYSTGAPADNAIFALLGGGDYQPADLWRFDLVTDAWTKVPTTDFPIGKYRQIVRDPVRHEILTFWDGLGQVYAVADTGGQWQPVGSTPDQDSWYGATSFWNATSNRLSLFGGYGLFTWKNTLWSFSRTSAAWSLTGQGNPIPWPRFSAEGALDETAQTLYVAGGQGYPTGNQGDGTDVLNDLWRLDLLTTTWTEIIPQDSAIVPTYLGGMDVVPDQHALYRFGGTANTNVSPVHLLNALDRVDLTAAHPAWVPVTTNGTPPSPRFASGVYFDAPRHRLLVVGGYTNAAPTLDVYALSWP